MISLYTVFILHLFVLILTRDYSKKFFKNMHCFCFLMLFCSRISAVRKLRTNIRLYSVRVLLTKKVKLKVIYTCCSIVDDCHRRLRNTYREDDDIGNILLSHSHYVSN